MVYDVCTYVRTVYSSSMIKVVRTDVIYDLASTQSRALDHIHTVHSMPNKDIRPNAF